MAGDLAGEDVGGLVAADGQQHVRAFDADLFHELDVRGVAAQHHDVQLVTQFVHALLGGVDDGDVVVCRAESGGQKPAELAGPDDDDFHVGVLLLRSIL